MLHPVQPRFLVALLHRMLACFVAGLLAAQVVVPKIHAQGPPPPNTVAYSPVYRAIQGTVPPGFGTTYQLTITAPPTLSAATSVAFGNIQVTAAPSGVSNPTALGYLSIAPSTLNFTAPNQALTVNVTLTVPGTATPGSYGYQIFTTGWANGPDNFGTAINATVSPSTGAGSPPSVIISTPQDLQAFNFVPSALPARIPFTFTSTATAGHPIVSVDANLDGLPIVLTSTTTNANATVTSNGTLLVTQPGTYHIQARAGNDSGTGAATNTFTVTVAGVPPTVAITSPTPNQVFTTVLGVVPPTPFTLNASSTFGNITAVTATLNGTSLTPLTVGLGTLAVSGTWPSLGITATGTYTLVVTATNPYGTASTQTTFTVVDPSVTPKLSLSIAKPVDGTIVTRVAGSPATVVPFSFTAAETNGTVSTLAAKLILGTSTTNATVATTGLNTASATGSGNLTVSTAGTYTFTATATGTGGLTTTSSVKFTVKETQPSPQPCTTKVLWLQPIADGKVQKGGCTVSVAFQIQQCCASSGSTGGGSADDDDDDDDDSYSSSWSWGGDKHNRRDVSESDYGDHSYGGCQVANTTCSLVKDTSVYVTIYEVFSNGTTGTPKTYSYTNGNVGTTHYAISSTNIYKLSFVPGSGKHRYHVEVDNFQNGSTTPTLLGTREFTTQ